jgi:hypothetical protein
MIESLYDLERTIRTDSMKNNINEMKQTKKRKKKRK